MDPPMHDRRKLRVLRILQWVSLVVTMSAEIFILFISDLRKVIFWKNELWKWGLMILVIGGGGLVSRWGFLLVVYLIGKNSSIRKRVQYFVHEISIQVEIFLGLGLILTVWLLLFDESFEAESWFRYLTKIQICFLVELLIYFVKTLMLNALVSSFHVRSYFDRIKNCLAYQFAIETLSRSGIDINIAIDTTPADLKNNELSTIKREREIGSEGLPRVDDKGITMNDLQKLSTENVCPTDMKRMMNIVQHQTISISHEQNLGASSSKRDDFATAAARKIFLKVSPHGSNSILLEDLTRFMRKEEAKSFFDLASNGREISESSLKKFVVKVLNEQKALAVTLSDIEAIVDKLHTTANIIIVISLIVVCLIILELITTKYILLTGVLGAVAAAISGNTGKTAFENVIYLFIIHPFDGGDLCEIDGVKLAVEKMNIMTTVFRTYNNEHIIMQNSVLSTKSIKNFSRSTDMIDSIEFFVHQSTPAEKIAAIRERILTYVAGKNEHWYPNPTIIVKELEPSCMVRREVRLTTRMSHQDMDERLAMRGSFVEEMVKILLDLNIETSSHGRNCGRRSSFILESSATSRTKSK